MKHRAHWGLPALPDAFLSTLSAPVYWCARLLAAAVQVGARRLLPVPGSAWGAGIALATVPRLLGSTLLLLSVARPVAGAEVNSVHVLAATTVPVAMQAAAPAASSASAPSAPTQRPAVTSAARPARIYVVRGAHDGRQPDSLWRIAERYLGDPARWREIYALNRGRPQPDGVRLTSPGIIHPGWTLRMPADAIDLSTDSRLPLLLPGHKPDDRTKRPEQAQPSTDRPRSSASAGRTGPVPPPPASPNGGPDAGWPERLPLGWLLLALQILLLVAIAGAPLLFDRGRCATLPSALRSAASRPLGHRSAPITFTDRIRGSSKMSARIAVKAALLVARLGRTMDEPAAVDPSPRRDGLPPSDPGPGMARDGDPGMGQTTRFPARTQPSWVPKGDQAGRPAAHLPASAGRTLLGQSLREVGAVRNEHLAAALHEQRRSGGRLGEILLAHGWTSKVALTAVLADRSGLPTVDPDETPTPLLPAHQARQWRAVALAGPRDDPSAPPHEPRVSVAFADPSPEVVRAVEDCLQQPVEAKLGDHDTLDRLLGDAYATQDIHDVTRELREAAPQLSAYRIGMSRPQLVLVALVVLGTGAGLLVAPGRTLVAWVAIATALYVWTTGFRVYMARKGWQADSTVNPTVAQVAALDERTLPVYSILLPVYREKPNTMWALIQALSKLEYPKHKLDGLLLIEADDEETQQAIKVAGRPAWLRMLLVPPGLPRTKPRAMGYGLRYARGEFLTVYDAEDRPDPLQLKKAIWGFRQADPALVCLQAKLGYYNPRQNLLTRWFTLEYDAWFSIFLPGLHKLGAPIPLGGTSNHFRTTALVEVGGWDPYNVTEDADLGLRLARRGLKTAMLESTTDEEANSKLPSWVRQRSRWIKGYMQTLLVHTRDPRTLRRELGLRSTIAFLTTVGGSLFTVLVTPIFWLMLLLWLVAQPGWISDLFPAPVYYPALLSLTVGNATLILLGLFAAVARGHDDLSIHTLMTVAYWALMSLAGYVALIELIVRPHHWHKTEHGLHDLEQADQRRTEVTA